jgi:peptide/nickel transport system ATP-binding protein
MLTVKQLTISFKRYGKVLQRQYLNTIHDISLFVNAGEMVAVVGASGAGKSLLAHAILEILPHNARIKGEIRFKNQLLTKHHRQRFRGKEITLIPQSVTFLNPLASIGAQVERAAKLAGIDPAEVKGATQRSLQRYGLSQDVLKSYPFQLSGGMARRVLTAMATVGTPDLIVADEPTTGLDQTSAMESLGWLRYLADQGKGILLITHDIIAALKVVDTVVVLHAGTTVEIAAAKNFNSNINQLGHPYTKSLWQALPQNGFYQQKLSRPAAPTTSGGCTYASHCHLADTHCISVQPKLERHEEGFVRCLNA